MLRASRFFFIPKKNPRNTEPTEKNGGGPRVPRLSPAISETKRFLQEMKNYPQLIEPSTRAAYPPLNTLIKPHFAINFRK